MNQGSNEFILKNEFIENTLKNELNEEEEEAEYQQADRKCLNLAG